MKKKKFRWWALVTNSIKLKTLEFEYQEKIQKYEREIAALNSRIQRVDDMLLTKLSEITKLHEEIEAKDAKISERNTERIMLDKEIKKLQKQLKESMTDKYIVRKIPSGRTPKGMKMKVSKRQAAPVRKFLKEVEKNNE